jgi:hypothetical protein
MNFGQMLFGSKGKMNQYATMDPQQLGASNQFLNQAQQGLQDPYAGFAPIEQHARSQFQQGLPSLAERFTSMGKGAQRSSGFQSALGRAGAGLEESLAAMRSQYGMQNRGQMMQLGQMGMQPRFENQWMPESQGLMQQLAPLLAQLGMGAATGGMTRAGLFGRNMMNQFQGGQGMGSLLPMLMMMGGQR